MSKRTTIVVAAFVALCCAAGGGLIVVKLFAGGSTTDVHVSASRIEYSSVARAVGAAQVVVVGTFLDERTETVREPSPVDPTHASTRVDVIRRFGDLRALKGAVPANTIEVRSTSSNHIEDMGGKFTDIAWDPLTLRPGQRYLLMLHSAADPALGAIWGVVGEPGTAEVGATNTLSFITSREYQADMRAKGQALGPTGAPSAFDVTLDVVIAAAGPASTP
ncbi:MAG TPA: hypothetical protein VIK11_13755 [Tepidiformaceae bacterium]